MRYSQILLEYDRSKTAERFLTPLYKRLRRDHSFENTYGMQCLNAWTAGPQRNGVKFEPFVVGNALKWLEDCDPTPNNEYVVWLVTRYVKGGIERWEDIHRAKNSLTEYHQLKQSGYFKRNPDKAALADIGRFNSLSELEIFVDNIPKADGISNAEKDKPGADEYKLLADTDRYRVVTPLTQKAASYFGRNTKWCTTSENGGAFYDYRGKGPLYIIIDKPNNRRWQWHFPTRQFMDERDKSVELKSFPKELWDALPPEMFISASREGGIVFVYAPKSIWTKFSPDDVKRLSFEGQESFAAFCPTEEDDGKHYRECLPSVRNEALCIAYSAGWHWDKGPMMLEELKSRTFNKGQVIDKDPKGHWALRIFPTFIDALLYDLQTNDHSRMWYILDTIFRGQSSGFTHRMREFRNPTMIETSGKNYLFMRSESRDMWTGWDGRERTWAGWYKVIEPMKEGRFPGFGDYDGPEDEPEMWKAIYQNLRKP